MNSVLFITPARCPAAWKGGEKKGETSACSRETYKSSRVKSPQDAKQYKCPMWVRARILRRQAILARLVMERSLEKGEFSDELDLD